MHIMTGWLFMNMMPEQHVILTKIMPCTDDQSILTSVADGRYFII